MTVEWRYFQSSCLVKGTFQQISVRNSDHNLPLNRWAVQHKLPWQSSHQRGRATTWTLKPFPTNLTSQYTPLLKSAWQCDIIYYIKMLHYILLSSWWAFVLHFDKLIMWFHHFSFIIVGEGSSLLSVLKLMYTKPKLILLSLTFQMLHITAQALQ